MKLIGIKEISGKIILKSGLHIGAGDTEMKIGGTDNPVVKHMALGEQMGIRGTPSVVFPNGEVVMSYIPPKKMIQMLEVGTKAN